MKMDVTDWFMLVFVAALHAAATVFLFKNQSTANFTVWAGLLTVSGGVFHGVRVFDQKRADCHE
jgi:hypothetical protein